MEMEELKRKRWTNGKEAVRAIKDVALAPGNATIGCEGHVRLARFRSKNHPGVPHRPFFHLDKIC
ncbi:uncharacterized protein PHALS_00822 [Plasmopara halstedii]|uniref:Uncharacterized protein n=1 Tax=Plasmopara halstedii TaxID=4781 RepID=A0A0P1AS19_PLAHL|nr:uncharacterized protein PHALS_00822 [Plasmopara halstedii]CEG44458.1 hypothetical protein PHALS_00822 [Plasmopara halstedii]|eukprot:XP_024580827.1 hypothetical protein PHALS_00822 [Plasmopara halstedii]